MQDAIHYLPQIFLWQPLGHHKKEEGYNLYGQRMFWEKIPQGQPISRP